MNIFILKTLFAAICIIESSGNPNAVNGKAVGIAQIQPNVIADVNKWGYHYTLNDRLDPCKSEKIFYLYTNYYITNLWWKQQLKWSAMQIGIENEICDVSGN